MSPLATCRALKEELAFYYIEELRANKKKSEAGVAVLGFKGRKETIYRINICKWAMENKQLLKHRKV
ncbi:hypothetical protein Tco_0693558 [Tanacetum coccineum]